MRKIRKILTDKGTFIIVLHEGMGHIEMRDLLIQIL
jgi:hypothetical protein